MVVCCPRSPSPGLAMPRFCVADCPACRTRFRLVWKVGSRKIKLAQALRLSCPGCGIRFETKAVELVVFNAGAEHFPVSSPVDTSCLVG